MNTLKLFLTSYSVVHVLIIDTQLHFEVRFFNHRFVLPIGAGTYDNTLFITIMRTHIRNFKLIQNIKITFAGSNFKMNNFTIIVNSNIDILKIYIYILFYIIDVAA